MNSLMSKNPRITSKKFKCTKIQKNKKYLFKKINKTDYGSFNQATVSRMQFVEESSLVLVSVKTLNVPCISIFNYLIHIDQESLYYDIHIYIDVNLDREKWS